jgi:hypothetical protein
MNGRSPLIVQTLIPVTPMEFLNRREKAIAEW